MPGLRWRACKSSGPEPLGEANTGSKQTASGAKDASMTARSPFSEPRRAGGDRPGRAARGLGRGDQPVVLVPAPREPGRVRAPAPEGVRAWARGQRRRAQDPQEPHHIAALDLDDGLLVGHAVVELR